MNVYNPSSSLSNMWRAYNNMPSKTTALDRIVEKEKAAREATLNRAIAESKSKDHIKSKIVEPGFFKRFDQAKAQRAANTKETLQAFKRFQGKGMKFDRYA
ncbi:hypothetical protein ACR6HW_07465 [Fusibacter sp. JL298sf-3]